MYSLYWSYNKHVECRLHTDTVYYKSRYFTSGKMYRFNMDLKLEL